jgi:hypothetical protein
MKAVSHYASVAGFANKGTTKFVVPDEPDRTVRLSPFNRPRERSFSSFSTGPLALEFNIPEGKSLADYFWIPMAKNNPLFDAFVIEFKDLPKKIDAIVWILQMTLNKKHEGSPEGYGVISIIKRKARKAMETMSRSKKQKKDVIAKYVLVSPKVGDGRCQKRAGGRTN